MDDETAVRVTDPVPFDCGVALYRQFGYHPVIRIEPVNKRCPLGSTLSSGSGRPEVYRQEGLDFGVCKWLRIYVKLASAACERAVVPALCASAGIVEWKCGPKEVEKEKLSNFKAKNQPNGVDLLFNCVHHRLSWFAIVGNENSVRCQGIRLTVDCANGSGAYCQTEDGSYGNLDSLSAAESGIKGPFTHLPSFFSSSNLLSSSITPSFALSSILVD